LINGIHGLILFQDGVFANTYCDQLFGQIQILNSPQKVTRSFHSIMAECRKHATETDAIANVNLLRLSYSSTLPENQTPLQYLNDLQLFMDIPWPANIIIDDEAMGIYLKMNNFFTLIKYIQWNIDNIWSQRKVSSLLMPRLMVIRAEMGHFLRGIEQHCMKFVVYNQAFKFKSDIEELSNSGELNMNSLYERHLNFLRKCRNQCLLSPVAGVFSKIVRKTMLLILKFCSLFSEFVSTRDESLKPLLLNLGVDSQINDSYNECGL
jgi:hypothetical protein